MFRTWTNFRRHFRPYLKSIMGLTRHHRVIIMVMTYRGDIVLARMKVYGTFWFVKVFLLSNSHDSLLLKLLYGTLFHKYSHGSKKIFLFQANSNLIRHLQYKSCKIGKWPVQRKERKTKHTNSSVIITMQG